MLLETLVVLLQSNTAGKSYSLDALQLLSEAATPSRKLPILRYCWNGVLKPKDLIKRERLTFFIEVDLRLRDTVVDAVKRRIQGMRRLSGDCSIGGPPPARVRERDLRYRARSKLRIFRLSWRTTGKFSAVIDICLPMLTDCRLSKIQAFHWETWT